MTTTCSDIVTRALALSVANQGVLDVTQAADVQDALVRIQYAQALAFTRYTVRNKTGFLTQATVTSTTGNGGRTVSLAPLTRKVQRILRVTLPSGVEVALVDPNVPTAEMAPRYFAEGETLVEVLNDWDTATANPVTLSALYASRPDDLDVSASGTLAQTVSIPDRHTNILVYDLGAFLAEKDVGREDAEVADLIAKRDQALADWIESGIQFGGTAVYSFDVPTPSSTSKD